MSALLIGPDEQTAIEALKTYAAANPLDPVTMIQLAKRDIDGFCAVMFRYTIRLPTRYAVTFSHEKQPLGLCHHISISVETTDNKLPSMTAVEFILEAFGMQPLSNSVKVWLEHVNQGHDAVNIVQTIGTHPHHEHHRRH